MEVHLFVEDLQQLFAGFLVVELRKVEEVAVRDVSGGVVVASNTVRELHVRIDLHGEDVERWVGVVPGIAVPAALIAGHLHQEVVGVKLPENEAIDIGAVASAAQDILA